MGSLSASAAGAGALVLFKDWKAAVSQKPTRSSEWSGSAEMFGEAGIEFVAAQNLREIWACERNLERCRQAEHCAAAGADGVA